MENKKDQRKEVPRRKEEEGVYTQTFVSSGEKLILRLSATDLSAASKVGAGNYKTRTANFKFDYYRRGICK